MKSFIGIYSIRIGWAIVFLKGAQVGIIQNHCYLGDMFCQCRDIAKNFLILNPGRNIWRIQR